LRPHGAAGHNCARYLDGSRLQSFTPSACLHPDLQPEPRSVPVPVPVPGALLLVFALLGCVLRALQLMIEAPAPRRSQAVRQLAQGPPLPGFDSRQQGPALMVATQKGGNTFCRQGAGGAVGRARPA
jgi:hypothetical protein